jgi:DNA-binding response OmpR family regulator
MNLLIAHSDPRTARFLADGLRTEGYAIDYAHSGREVLALAATRAFQLLLLDAALDIAAGGGLVRALRAARNPVLILMLALAQQVEERVGHLRRGADDCLPQPFQFEELAARVAALARRAGGYLERAPLVMIGDLVLDRHAREVSRSARPIELTAKEFAVLDLLASAPGRAFSRAQILARVWGVNADPLTNVVDVHLSHLRRKIDQPHQVKLIRTVRSVGYKLLLPPGASPVSCAPAAAGASPVGAATGDTGLTAA